jgi:adenosylhomocysteine nucleosidase
MAKLLIVAPQADEAEALCRGFDRKGLSSRTVDVGRLTCTLVPSLDALIAVGGNGKAQFAVQAQHLLDHCRDAELLCCAGAAGRLHGDVSVGDVVVGTCTIEHDYTERFIQQPLPCHHSDAGVLRQFEEIVATQGFPFRVHLGPIASGDEDIVDAVRSADVFAATQALCVAWEGSGAARAARFSGAGFVEIRAITDAADKDAAQSFHAQLATVLPNICDLVVAWRFGTHASRSLDFQADEAFPHS